MSACNFKCLPKLFLTKRGYDPISMKVRSTNIRAKMVLCRSSPRPLRSIAYQLHSSELVGCGVMQRSSAPLLAAGMYTFQSAPCKKRNRPPIIGDLNNTKTYPLRHLKHHPRRTSPGPTTVARPQRSPIKSYPFIHTRGNCSSP
jgi:hypothetical protein